MTRNPAPMDDGTDATRSAIDWFVRHRDGLDAADERAFHAWLGGHPDHAAAYDDVVRSWSVLGDAPPSADMAAILAKAQAYTPPSMPPSTRWRHLAMGAMAASLVAAIGLAGWVTVTHNRDPARVIETRRGERMVVDLEDGSRLNLDSDTRIELRFSAHRRDVALAQGQAFFHVAHDVSRPFVVRAGQREVVAVGTQFNVLREGAAVSVALAEGKVRVEPEGLSAHPARAAPGSDIATLQVGQVLSYGAGPTVLARDIDMGSLTSWRDGVLNFDRTPLEQAVRAFDRYSKLPIRIAGRDLGTLCISGSFHTDSAEGFLSALSTSFPVTVQHGANEIVISSAPHPS